MTSNVLAPLLGLTLRDMSRTTRSSGSVRFYQIIRPPVETLLINLLSRRLSSISCQVDGGKRMGRNGSSQDHHCVDMLKDARCCTNYSLFPSTITNQVLVCTQDSQSIADTHMPAPGSVTLAKQSWDEKNKHIPQVAHPFAETEAASAILSPSLQYLREIKWFKHFSHPWIGLTVRC